MLLELSVPYSEGATRAYLNYKEGQKQQAQQAQQQGGQEERGDGGREWGYCSAGAARELAEVRACAIWWCGRVGVYIVLDTWRRKDGVNERER